MVAMNILVGLGNPGDRYMMTRHNAGAIVLDNLRKVMQCSEFNSNTRIFCDVCKTGENIFIKPQVFMNESGKAVRSAIDFYKVGDQADSGGYKNLFVIHDDLDMTLGTYKIQYGIGPKAHNGLLSIYQHLGTRNFWHVRVGIDSRELERNIPPTTYVLETFTPLELEKFRQVEMELVKELQQKL